MRDGGVPGTAAVRLGRGFNDIKIEGNTLRARHSCARRQSGARGSRSRHQRPRLYRGIPGCVGGALRMNAGAHGRETKDCLVSARAVDLDGNVYVLTNKEMGFSYRHCDVQDGWIFTEATYAGEIGNPADILKEMDEVAEYREKISRSRSAQAARPSKIRRTTVRGSLSMPPAAAACAMAVPRYPSCTATS